MKRILLLSLFLLSLNSYSQEDAWVYFNDKPSAATYLANPLSMLSQRALDRRTMQGIVLDMTDVPVEQTYIDQIAVASGIEIKSKSKWLNCLHIRGSIADITALTSLSFVNHIHFADNSLNSKSAVLSNVIVPVNKQLEAQVAFPYGNSANQIQMLNGHLLHQNDYTGTGKIIAVLDAGFPNVDVIQPFQRLRDNNKILGGFDFVNDNANFYTGNSHGTSVLSTMGGYTDGQLVGTAPDAQYYLYITEDVSSENPVEESYWVEAAEEADRVGADIISTSLGYFDYDNVNYSHTYQEMIGTIAFASQGANAAFSKGIIVVASAGNSGNSSEPHIGVPAEATNVLTIGAVKADETYATFSSIGPSFDGRVKPDVMAQGQASVLSNASGNIVVANGTSFSCPIMAGMVASFWQAVPSLTNQQVVDFIKQSADHFTMPNEQFGYGIPDFQLALNNAILSMNQSQNANFILYPNPTNDILQIKIIGFIPEITITFYNTLGQLVFAKTGVQNNQTINLSSLSLGMYSYKVESATFSSVGKIIKK